MQPAYGAGLSSCTLTLKFSGQALAHVSLVSDAEPIEIDVVGCVTDQATQIPRAEGTLAIILALLHYKLLGNSPGSEYEFVGPPKNCPEASARHTRDTARWFNTSLCERGSPIWRFAGIVSSLILRREKNRRSSVGVAISTRLLPSTGICVFDDGAEVSEQGLIRLYSAAYAQWKGKRDVVDSPASPSQLKLRVEAETGVGSATDSETNRQASPSRIRTHGEKWLLDGIPRGGHALISGWRKLEIQRLLWYFWTFPEAVHPSWSNSQIYPAELSQGEYHSRVWDLSVTLMAVQFAKDVFGKRAGTKIKHTLAWARQLVDENGYITSPEIRIGEKHVAEPDIRQTAAMGCLLAFDPEHSTLQDERLLSNLLSIESHDNLTRMYLIECAARCGSRESLHSWAATEVIESFGNNNGGYRRDADLDSLWCDCMISSRIQYSAAVFTSPALVHSATQHLQYLERLWQRLSDKHSDDANDRLSALARLLALAEDIVVVVLSERFQQMRGFREFFSANQGLFAMWVLRTQSEAVRCAVTPKTLRNGDIATILFILKQMPHDALETLAQELFR